jgi:hypothetical protein
MSEEIQRVEENIEAFTRKYYRSLGLRGFLLTGSILLGYFLLISLLEAALWMPGTLRLLVLLAFFALAAYCVLHFLKQPLLWWLQKRGLSRFESAQIIGRHFPSVGDRLLNVLQLWQSPQPSALWQAGIRQKAAQCSGIAFEEAVDLRENLSYLKILAIPLLALVAILLFNQSLLTQSAYRLVRFQEEFTPAAPFRFVVNEEELSAYFNEDFVLHATLTGSAVPEAVYVLMGKQRMKMTRNAEGAFQYTFERVQAGFSFQLEGAGFLSPTYTLALRYRPELTHLGARLEYPRYLGLAPATLQNAGNLRVPEGTRITWTVDALHAEAAHIRFSTEDSAAAMSRQAAGTYQFSRSFRQPANYRITLSNADSHNKEDLAYAVAVIKDEYPTVTLHQQKDSALFRTLWLGGTATDDHGITEMRLRYQVVRGQREEAGSHALPIAGALANQRFFYTWNLDSLKLKPGDILTYFVQVWDNDGVNGRKAGQSATFRLALPSQQAIEQEIEQGVKNTQNQFQQNASRAEDIRKGIDEAIQKLRGKTNLDWQDRQFLQDLINRRRQLEQQIEKMQQQAKQIEQKKDQFSEESERLKEKSEEVQKRLDELLDEESRKLLEELEKLLKDNTPSPQLMKLLEQIQRKERDFKKDLARAEALYKQLQYEYKLEQTTEKLADQIARQEELLKKTDPAASDTPDKDSPKPANQPAEKDTGSRPPASEQLAAEQDELQKQTEALQDDFNELKEMGNEVEEPADLPNERQMEEIRNEQQNSSESLKQNKNKKSAQHQKQAVQKMKSMKNQLQSALADMQMELDLQNLESLRQIVHGLVKISFDQENITKEFLPVLQTDPAYVTLSQRQLKLKDDVKVLEDSLLALSKRDPMMNALVTKEIGNLNSRMEKAVEYVRDRKKGNAGTEMQLAMTSVNNLALLLNDHFDALMQMLQNAMMMPGKGKKKGNQNLPNLGELQRLLNQRTEELMKSGKSGRELSEELARIALEQEAIRRTLQDLQEKMKKDGQKPGGNLPGKMEETELDLINKRLTNQLIQRQREILTRLLETEKALREQNTDEERKGEAAKSYENAIPPSFEQYLKLKEKEIELLKTVPPRLHPYYKNEVNEYFKRLGNSEL